MAVENLKEVYVLQHVHEFEDGHEDVKLWEIFSSEAKAKEVIEKYKKMPGFQIADRDLESLKFERQ